MMPTERTKNVCPKTWSNLAPVPVHWEPLQWEEEAWTKTDWTSCPVVLLPLFASSLTDQYPLVCLSRRAIVPPNFWRQRVNFFDTMLQELRAAVPAFGMSPSSRLRALTLLEQLLLLYSSCSSCSILANMKEHRREDLLSST